MNEELLYRVLQAVSAVVLCGVVVYFIRGVRDGLRQNRAARLMKEQRERLLAARQVAGLAAVAAQPEAIEPEVTEAVERQSGRPLKLPFPGFPGRYSLPLLTDVEFKLLQRVGVGADIRDAGDATRLRRLNDRHPALLSITRNPSRPPGVFFHCRVRLWAWTELQLRNQDQGGRDAQQFPFRSASGERVSAA